MFSFDLKAGYQHVRNIGNTWDLLGMMEGLQNICLWYFLLDWLLHVAIIVNATP